MSTLKNVIRFVRKTRTDAMRAVQVMKIVEVVNFKKTDIFKRTTQQMKI